MDSLDFVRTRHQLLEKKHVDPLQRSQDHIIQKVKTLHNKG